jgi:hypothetical protein
VEDRREEERGKRKREAEKRKRDENKTDKRQIQGKNKKEVRDKGDT